MSYARKTRRLVHRYKNINGHRFKTGIGMSGWLDDLFGTVSMPGADDAEIAQCLTDGNAASANFDAKRADLSKNWHPNGFYNPSEMGSLISMVFAMLQSSEAMLENVSVSDGNIKNAQDEIFRKYVDVQMYQKAAAQASQTGQVVNAPGFRDWVIGAMGTASDGVTAAVVTSCIAPWWAGALAAFQSAFDAVYSAAKKIVGVVIDAATTVLKVADTSFAILKYVPYAAAAVGIYIVINELRVYKRLRS